jgi:phosphoribosylformimino-5-aminoimidazole carboxamide ribonucleotide (ProFAR) isomerase
MSDREAARFWMSGGTTSTSDYRVVAANSVEVVVGRALEQAPIGLREVVHVINASD